MQVSQNNYRQQKYVLCLPPLPITNHQILTLFRRSIQERLEKRWLDAEELPGLYAQQLPPQRLVEKLMRLASEARFLSNEMRLWS